ncbi:MAG: hypothetical protein Aurels2KO_47570 [Aureliella sp.]
MLATDKLGSHIPHPTCRWSWLRVEVLEPKSIVTIDEETGEARPLPYRDAVVLQVHWRLICRMLASTMELSPEYRIVSEIPGLSQITVDRSSTKQSVPIYLASGDFVSSVMHLTARIKSPCIVLRTCNWPIDSSLQLLMDSKLMLDVSLSECTQLDARRQVTFTESASQQLADFRAEHCPRSNSPEPILNIPDHATWASLRIRFIDNETIRVNVGGESGIFHYTQLGMANSRNARPVKQWLLLHTYAESHGVLTWGDRGASPNLKKQTQELNKKLIAAFAINGTPIEYDKSIKGYRTVFAIDEN